MRWLPASAVTVLILWPAPVRAATPAGPCSDTLEPLVAVLAAELPGTEGLDGYGLSVFLSGAGLALGWEPGRGLSLPPRQQLLWPGNFFGGFDSLYVPRVPASLRTAESLLVAVASAGQRILIYGPEPVRITAVDTTLGAPWFFVALCDSGGRATNIWDRHDLRRVWWRWRDLPGANSVWIMPERLRPQVGRTVLRRGMRNLVLAARPDSSGDLRFGLAALTAAAARPDRPPGTASTLGTLGRLRAAAAGFLAAQSDLWPPARREPVRLAAYYLQKDAESWLTLAAAAGSWDTFDPLQRQEWLEALADWETRAAVALDQLLNEPD